MRVKRALSGRSAPLTLPSPARGEGIETVSKPRPDLSRRSPKGEAGRGAEVFNAENDKDRGTANSMFNEPLAEMALSLLFNSISAVSAISALR